MQNPNKMWVFSYKYFFSLKCVENVVAIVHIVFSFRFPPFSSDFHFHCCNSPLFNFLWWIYFRALLKIPHFTFCFCKLASVELFFSRYRYPVCTAWKHEVRDDVFHSVFRCFSLIRHVNFSRPSLARSKRRIRS